ncbi:MAG: GtrA family protein, partial [Bifidobacteriaceae bacterium]|nr:GtrA family protein [Bifidobacteriaceae bacterium]
MTSGGSRLAARLGAVLTNRRIWRYVAVGIGGYLVEVAILLTLPRLGASGEVAVTVSYWVGLVVSFAAQKLLAFSNFAFGRLLARQALAYALLVLVNWGFTV